MLALGGTPRLCPLLLLSIAISACRDIDVVTGAYATVADARRAGAFDRRNIPDILPPGAHDIREAHDLDTNRRWGLFSFTDTDADALQRVLGPVDAPLETRSCDVPRRIEWWPALLRGQLDSKRIQATGLEAHGSSDGPLVVLVNWKQRRAYYCSY